MIFSLLVNAAPYSQQGAHSAYQFSQALIAKGHQIRQIFFYRDGVHNANLNIQSPTPAWNLPQLWSEIARTQGVDLVVCVTAAAQRGLNSGEIATLHSKLAPGFRISGLGQLLEAIIQSDRFIVFNGP